MDPPLVDAALKLDRSLAITVPLAGNALRVEIPNFDQSDVGLPPSVFERVYGNVSTDQLEAWDIAREMCFRTAWKPYMYSLGLPHLLGGVQAPALVVWGDDDRIVPRSTADAYVRALPSARLEIVPDCGHLVDMEKPDELARLVSAFVTAN